MPDRYLIANWKMNLPPEGIEAFSRAMSGAETGVQSIVIAPPFPYLKEVVRSAAPHIHVAGQNCGDYEKGAYTGEVSAAMLRDCGARFVILGHSERRTVYGETDSMIARKLSMAIAAGLTPVLCIGEDLRTRDANHVARFLADQIKAAAVEDLAKAPAVVIAYEPIWAIGTGRNATGAMVADTVSHIRESLERFWPVVFADSTPILYGGSVTPENVPDLIEHGQIDGFLVGGASLESARFLGILKGMRARSAA